MKLRTKAITLTVVFIIIYYLFQLFNFDKIIQGPDIEIVKALVVSLVFMVGLFWVLGFKVKGIRIVTILGYSSYIVFIQSLFLELVVYKNVERISQRGLSLLILFIFALNVYFLILTMNILNVSYISRIPLAQAAKASNFIYTLFGAYLSFLIISKIGILELFKVAAYVLVIFLLTLNLFWFKKESFRQLFGETMAVVLVMFMLFVVLLPWPLSVELFAMFLIIIYYILLGLGLEERETTSVLMRIEYVVLLLFSVLLILRLSIWGINGAIL